MRDGVISQILNILVGDANEEPFHGLLVLRPHCARLALFDFEAHACALVESVDHVACDADGGGEIVRRGSFCEVKVHGEEGGGGERATLGARVHEPIPFFTRKDAVWGHNDDLDVLLCEELRKGVGLWLTLRGQSSGGVEKVKPDESVRITSTFAAKSDSKRE